MIRFYYDSNKKISVRDSNSFKLDGRDRTNELTNTEEAILNNAFLKKCTNYQEFLDAVKYIRRYKFERLLMSAYYDKIFYLFNFNENEEMQPLISYTVEDDEYLELLKNMTGNYTEGKLRIMSSNISNSFSVILPEKILSLFFVDTELKIQNKPRYNVFYIKKKSGKLREIVAPDPSLKERLRDLNNLFQYLFDKKNEKFQVAYKKGKSIKDNALIHANNDYIFNIDLSDFFPSCKRELVRKYIQFLFYNCPNGEWNREYFLDIILKDDGLYIGSPISGTLANRIIAAPVKYLKNICDGFGMGFSVYADDMTFSSDRYISETMINEIFSIAFTTYGLDGYFKMNPDKSHGKYGCNRSVTGVAINNKNQITAKRDYYMSIRAGVHQLSIGNPNVNIYKLRGEIAFYAMLDYSGKLYKYLNKFLPTVQKYHLCSDETLEKLKSR